MHYSRYLCVLCFYVQYSLKLLTLNVDCWFQLIVVCIYRLVMISIKWSETAQKNALASTDIIVTQLLRYHMPLLYFACNHLILTV